jgi:HAD superfamily hydrolase (TIGR01458 family)
MKAILFDLDGVLYNSETPISGAAEAVGWVQENGIPHLFVTNTTSRGRAALVEKLNRFGICADHSQILTPCNAAAEWIKKRKNGKTALFVSPRARPEFDHLNRLPEEAESGADYIVIGDLGDAWNFQKLNRAFRLLHSNPEAVLIALGMTRFWHAHDGIRLDAGPFVAALERATGRKAIVLGKPAVSFFRTAIDHLGLKADEIVMIGDDIETDIAGAQQSGMSTVLMRTGKFRDSDLNGPITPDAVMDSIADLPDWIKDSRLKIKD